MNEEEGEMEGPGWGRWEDREQLSTALHPLLTQLHLWVGGWVGWDGGEERREREEWRRGRGVVEGERKGWRGEREEWRDGRG